VARNDFVTLIDRLHQIRDHVLELIFDVETQQGKNNTVCIPTSEVSKKLGDLDAGLWSVYHSVIKEVTENA
jgi:hypothetical protein